MNHDYGDGVIAIDTYMHGLEEITAIYFLPGERPAIIETGPGSSIEAIEKGMSDAGVDTLDWIVLTHIHLDHAGAAGHLARKFPEAKVVVRQEGAPHLIDPSRLWASASRIYPDMEELWGEIIPIPHDQVVAIGDDGPAVDLGGGRGLSTFHAPGHANHQMALLETSSGQLFTGDAIGVLLPSAGVIRPATPPPEFDLEVWLATLERLKSIGAARLFPTHFGPVPDVGAALEEAALRLNQWTQGAREVFDEGGGVAEIAQGFRDRRDDWYPGLDPEKAAKFESLTSYEMNAMGIHRYLKKAAERG